MDAQIHWHEGLFLQPHHLQRMQKGMRDLVSHSRRLTSPYPYGVIEARVSRDALENMRVQFERLHAVMPSGLEIDFPGNTELASVDIKQALSKGGGSFRVSLGVPIWFAARGNTLKFGDGADARAKLLYRIGEVECTDENTGENPRPVQVRLINARLLLDNEDTSDLEVLPLMRIERATGAQLGLPQADPEFAPPCLVLGGSQELTRMITDLVEQVQSTRKALVRDTLSGGFNIANLREAQIGQVLSLRTLNRFSATLPALLAAPMVTPFQLYVELRELLAELVALDPQRDEFETDAYDHDAPYNCFSLLCEAIRRYLIIKKVGEYWQVDFAKVGDIYAAEFKEDHFKANAYYFAIKGKAEALELARYVEDGDRFRFMPRSMATLAIRGIPLVFQKTTPSGLPDEADLHYFRVDRAANEARWRRAQEERALGFVWDFQASGRNDGNAAAFSLIMPQPT